MRLQRAVRLRDASRFGVAWTSGAVVQLVWTIPVLDSGIGEPRHVTFGPRGPFVPAFDRACSGGYPLSMKSNTKSSITLPSAELALVNRLKKRLGAKTKVEVIRRGLYLLRDTTERDALRKAYARAATALRASTLDELDELDGLTHEGLDGE